MKVSLVVTQGAYKGKEIPINVSPFLIGRDSQCNLRPSTSTISRRHCAVVTRQGQVFVRDFGSTNGTLVNGQRVTGEQELSDQDQLTLEPLVFFNRIRDQVPVDRRTPLPPKQHPGMDGEDEGIMAALVEELEAQGGPQKPGDLPPRDTTMIIPDLADLDQLSRRNFPSRRSPR